MRVVSLFAGGGGLDLGFKQAEFQIIWANEYDSKIWETYSANNPETVLDRRNLSKIKSNEIPDCDGIIGGPPCQSWASSGANRGFDDKRGKVFLDYIRIIHDKRPKFFLIENVEGLLRKTHQESFKQILELLEQNDTYSVSYKLLNAIDYDVPQDRKRVIFVGIRNDQNLVFNFPEPIEERQNLRDTIWDLKDLATLEFQEDNVDNCYLGGGWSPQFMSRNRVRNWDQPSFTIPATGRHIPIHPSAPTMIKESPDKWSFVPDHLYRRFTLRECARIQTFPDTYMFRIDRITDGYKIIGNAVPVKLAYHLAIAIKNTF